MQTPTQIVFQGLDRSDALVDHINEQVEKLQQFSEHLVSCHVSLHAESARGHKSSPYRVRIVCQVPGNSLVVDHGRGKPGQEDPYLVVRDGFRVMTRQVEDWQRKIRGDVKTHE